MAKCPEMSYRLPFSIAAFAGGAFSVAFGQTPPAKAPITTVSGTVGLTLVEGATDSQTYNMLGSVDRINKGIDSIHLDGAYFFSRQTQPGNNAFEIASNFMFVNGRYERNFAGKLAVYGSLGYRVDNPNNLTLRSVYGSGLAYQIAQSKAISWNVSGGYAYLIERYVDGSPTAFTQSASFGSQLNLTLSRRLTLTHTLSYTPALSDFSNYLATSVLSLGYDFSRGVKLTVNNVVDYTSDPPGQTLKKNNQWFVGLTYGGKL